MSFPLIPRPTRIYPNPTGIPYIKESFYLSSPKNLFGFVSKGFSVASPPSRSEESKRTWRSQIEGQVGEEDTFARRFIAAVDEMQKRVEELRRQAWGS